MKLLLIAALAAAPAWTVQKPTVLSTHDHLTVVQEAVRQNDVAITVEAVRFDAAHHALRMLDDPAGRYDLPGILKANGCVAGVNGGYFQPNGRPAGLMVAEGRRIEPSSPDRMLTGVVAAWPGRFSLLRVGEYKAPAVEARQCGPYLVDGGHVVEGLEETRLARRTAILSDGHGAGALLTCDPLPLASFAELLTTPGLVPGLTVSRALNLDGGPSTTFYTAKPHLYRPRFAGVRDYVGLQPVNGKR